MPNGIESGNDPINKQDNGFARALDLGNTGTRHPQRQPHYLDPLIPDEIKLATTACKSFLLGLRIGLERIRFNTVVLKEPPKALQVAFLKGEAPQPVRQALAIIQVREPGASWVLEADVVLGSEPAVIEWRRKEGVQPLVTVDDTLEAEEIFQQDAGVQTLLRERYGIEDPCLVRCDPWYYGARFAEPGAPLSGRLIQCFLYVALGGLESNHYAHPLDAYVVLDLDSRKVLNTWTQQGTSYKVPSTPVEFHRSLVTERRTPPKPLNIIQPEGPSFTVDGNCVSWQQWHLHVSFHYREGLVLSDIGYEDGSRIRPVIKRASTAEIIVPYGDPREPFHKKCAFDAMDYGLGVSATSLTLGCDCLGAIQYFDGCIVNAAGEPAVMKNVICMHEEDYGLAWKQVEYRSGHQESRRSRRLSISLTSQIANYSYCFFWYFYQDGTIQYEVKLTGILSTNGLSEGEGPQPEHGVLVAPGLNAQVHEHCFCVRLDMAVDDADGGKGLSVSEVNCESMPDGPANPHGVGFKVTETLLSTEHEAQRIANASSSRHWKIKNPRVINPVNGQPVAWKLVPGATTPLYANPSSEHFRRGRFASKHLWVTRQADDQLYPAGLYPLEPDPIGIEQWTSENRSLIEEDIVLWHTVGVTHVPRLEDFPVMPVEYAGFSLKPVNFFSRSPAINLPPAHNSACVLVAGGSCCKEQDFSSVQSAGCCTAKAYSAGRLDSMTGGVSQQKCCSGSAGCMCGSDCSCEAGCSCKLVPPLHLAKL